MANMASSLGTKLLCLTEGQTVKLSECNPSIRDKKCTTTSCQICVNEIRDGVYCPANINDCTDPCVEVFDDSDSINVDEPEVNIPVITLLDPQDRLIIEKPTNLDFSFRVTESFNIESCSLMLDSQVVAKNTARIQSKTNKISFAVPLGRHEWHIICKTKEGKSTLRSSNRVIFVGQESFENDANKTGGIDLISPVDNYQASGHQTINFEFEILKKDFNTAQCTLIIDNSINNTLSLIKENNSIPHSLNIGRHTWFIQCIDSTGINFFSEIRSLVLSAIEANAETSSGGGGGIVKNSIISNEKVQIEENNEQGSILTELSTANEESDVLSNNEPNQIESILKEESSGNGPFGITGAVTGVRSIINANKSIAIIFIVIIIAGLLMINLVRKKRENKNINRMIKSLA